MKQNAQSCVVAGASKKNGARDSRDLSSEAIGVNHLNTSKRALFLVNPKARRGSEALDVVRERLGAAGISVRLEPFEALPELARDIMRLRAECDIVIVGGGDGTVSASAMAIIDIGLPMGIMPLGTANDLARTLTIPMDLPAAADVIAAGATRRIDLGTVNGHAFFNVASIGLSTELADSLDNETKKRWGRLGYAVAATRVMSKARPFKATITEKGESFTVRTYQIAVGNGVHYGGGNVVQQDATIDDGHLDLYSLEVSSLWKLALMARSFRQGRHGAWSEVRTARCVEFDVETDRPRPVNTDGEIVTSTPAHFKVLPQAIEVFAPMQQAGRIAA